MAYRVAILLFHKPISLSASERFQTSLYNSYGRYAPGHKPFRHVFHNLHKRSAGRFQGYICVYADDPLIARSARNNDMIVASSQPEVHKVIAWSDKSRLTLNSSKCETAFFNLDSAEAAWQPNITIDGRLMFCNPFQIFFGVRYDRQLTFGQDVRKLCQRCPAASTSSELLGRTICGWLSSDRRQVTPRLYVACLNMQLHPGYLGYHLPPPSNSRKSSWRRQEPSPSSSAIPKLKQSSRSSSYPLFQRISKPSPS